MEYLESYISLTELSKRLSTSVRTLRAWVRDPTDPLPAYRLGGRLMFRWNDVEAWIQRHRVQPIDVRAVCDEIRSKVSDDE